MTAAAAPEAGGAATEGRARSRSPRCALPEPRVSSSSSGCPAERIAFVTLATASYAQGALVLTAGLRRQLRRSIDVIVFSPEGEELALPAGVKQRPLSALPKVLAPACAGEPVLPQFAFCWSKLGLWALEGYDVVIYMDADMLLVGDIAPLLSMIPGPGLLAAVPSCKCWCEEECDYTSAVGRGCPGKHHFNAGLLVLRPSREEFASMQRALAAATREFPFAEQDFLNQHFEGRVVPLPAAFNALKHALRNPKHASELPLERCVALHFVMAKPWERASRLEEEFEELHALWHRAREEVAGLAFVRPQWVDRLVHPALPGLWHMPDFMGSSTGNALLACLRGPDLAPRWQSLRRRRVLCLGGVPHPDGAICEALPPPLRELSEALAECGALSQPADQCFVNEYASGQGIDAHSDGPCFHPEVAILSLEGTAILRFGLVEKRARPDLPPRVEVLLRPGSLLVMHAEAYELYVHSIEHTALDRTAEGHEVPRAPRRTSLTMRRFAHVQLHAGDVNCEDHLAARAEQWRWWASELGEID